LADARQNNAALEAYIEYDFYLFTDSESTKATVYLTLEHPLTLNDTPRNLTWVLGDYISLDHVGDVPPTWRYQVMDQVWLCDVEEGHHTLRWVVSSPEVYLEKIVLDTHGGVKSSYPATTLVNLHEVKAVVWPGWRLVCSNILPPLSSGQTRMRREGPA
jgi:hypothetical protein